MAAALLARVDAAPLNSPTAVSSGDVLDGRYRILHLLAVGGMGSVFLAEHLLIKRRLAIKVLHPELACDRLNVGRFMNEALAAGTLGHPNIVEATDMGFVRDLPFIVFEYLEGASLTEEIYRVGGLGIRRAVDIAIQIAGALDAAHTAGIIHLDLKCDNVMITDRAGTSDHVKVLDFGISKFASTDVERTNPTVISGTPEWMAPEQIEDPDNVDPRTDVYALGVCLYEMLAARRPFSGDDPRVLLHRVVHEAPPPLPAWIPDDLRRAVMDRMLAKDPRERFASMDDVVDALKDIASDMRSLPDFVLLTPDDAKQSYATYETIYTDDATSIVPAAQRPTYPPAPTSRRGTKLVAAAITLAAVGAAVAFMFFGPMDIAGRSSRSTAVIAAPAPVAITQPVDIAPVRAGIELATQRARAMARSPMLRAAIETDAATVQDLLREEASLQLDANETIEILQTRTGEPTLLARVPDGEPLSPGATRIDTRASRIEVTVPILDRTSKQAGQLVLAVPLRVDASQIAALRDADPSIVVD